MPGTSSSAKDSRPQSVHSAHEERGQPAQSRSGLAAAGATSARPVRPVSARPLVGGKLEDDPYYSFWLKQTQSKTGGVISAKRPSSRPRSALPQARETDLEDVWVAPRAEGLPSYDPVKDKHLESYFQRRAPDRKALESVHRTTESDGRRKIKDMRAMDVLQWSAMEQERIQLRMREIQQSAMAHEMRSKATTPLIVCILDSHTSQGGLLHSKAGVPISFSLQVKYAFGNKLEEGGSELTNWCEKMGGFHAVVGGVAHIVAAVTYCGRGIFRFDCTATIAGHYQVSVRLGSRDIPGSPFPLFVEEGGTDVTKVAASGMGLLCTEAGIPAAFTLFARDAYGNVRSYGGDHFRVTVVGPVSFDATVTDRGDGTYECSYKTIMCGDYFIHVQLEGQHIPGSPFMASVVPAHTYAPSCRAWGDGLHATIVGHEAEFMIEAKDLIGNRKIIGGEKFTCTAAGPSNIDVQILDCDDGTYIARYMVTVAGEYLLDVMYDGLPLNGSPFALKASPGPTIAVKCSANGKALTQVASTVPASFVIDARDEFGNLKAAGGDAFVVRVRGVRAEVAAHVADRLDGTYEVRFTCEYSGVYFVSVLLGGVDVRGSPFKTVCVSGDLVLSECRVVGAGACGGFTQVDNTFEIHTHDKFGNALVAGGHVFDALLWGPERTVASVLDRQDGTYLVTYRLTTAGEYQLRVMYNEVDLPGSPFVCYLDPLPNEMYSDLYSAVQGRTPIGQPERAKADADVAAASMALLRVTDSASAAEAARGAAPVAAVKTFDPTAPLFWKCEFTIRQARNLSVMADGACRSNEFGLFHGDPVVVVTHSGASAHTKPANGTSNPEWNQTISLVVADLSEAAELRVCEYDALTGSYDASAGGRTFGLTRIALLAAVPGEVSSRWFPLGDSEAGGGSVFLDILITKL